ncbi:MAG: nucleoside hydrolase [Bacteroidota bacterium]
MKSTALFHAFLFALLMMAGCKTKPANQPEAEGQIPVIIDSDANNELDDQHAIAYLLLNPGAFQTIGVTVNATWGGGDVGEHVKEARRIVKLCGLEGKIPVLAGANGTFPEIREFTCDSLFDGHAAVDFIITEAMKERSEKLVLVPVGKLTNIALALKKEPAVAERIRVVWLGSNYPEPGEYNQDNDTASMNYVLGTDVPFEMATVRYGKPSGTAAVTVTQADIFGKMPGLGPHIEEPVSGRHGGTFSCFGDYSVSLFTHIDYSDEAKTRSLFDMAAVAIVKDSSWATASVIPAPILVDGQWVERPDNKRKILVWEYFDREKILADFYATFE